MTIFSGAEYRLFVAQSLSFCVGLLVSFFGNRQYTFWSKSGYVRQVRSQVIAFLTLSTMNLCLTNLALWFTVAQLNIRYELAKIVIMIFIVAWNYILMKYVIFHSKSKDQTI